MTRFEATLVAALAWASLLGCGGKSAHPLIDETGSGGAPGGKPSTAGAGAADSGRGGESGNAGGLRSRRECNPDAPLARDVLRATEQCLDPDLVVTDLDLLDGKSFVLESGLCPVNEPSEEWSNNGGFYSGASLRTLHLRKRGDELELVSSMPTSTEPIVQRSILEPTSLGFGAQKLVVCSDTVYASEDAYKLVTYEAPLVHLAFVPGETPGELELVLAARIDIDEATVVLEGTPDVEGPTFDALDVPGE